MLGPDSLKIRQYGGRVGLTVGVSEGDWNDRIFVPRGTAEVMALHSEYK